MLSVALLAPLFYTTPTLGDEAQRKALAGEVVGAMNMVDQIKNTLPMFQNQLLMTLARKYPTASEKTIKEIKKLSDDFILEMVATAKPKMAQIIEENFSEKEMADIITFFNSSSGKAFVKKQPSMSNAMMQWTNSSMMDAMTTIDKKVQKLLEEEKN